MKEWLEEKQDASRTFFASYGKLLLVVVLLVACLLCGAALFIHTTHKTLHVSFLDVGQGDAILIRTPSGHTMLIDGGPGNVVLDRLSHELGYFDHHLDVVVATHPDADHITGLVGVLAHYDVDTIIMSPISGTTGVFEELSRAITEEHAQQYVGKKGDTIIFGDGVVAHILYPSTYYYGDKDTNDASVSMVITYGDESVLLTGDLPSTHEGELLYDELPEHVTLYKAGHHGSKYSSGEQLLSYIRPEYAVISAGKNNRYGHPNAEALQRLTTYSKEILSTIDKGTITFSLDGEHASVTSTR